MKVRGAVAEGVQVPDGDGGLTEAVGLCRSLQVALREAVGLHDCVADRERDRDGDRVPDGGRDGEAVRVAEADAGEAVREGLALAEQPTLRVTLRVTDEAVALAVRHREVVGVCVAVRSSDAEAVGDGECDRVAVRGALAVGVDVVEADRLGLAVPVREALWLCAGDCDEVQDAVAVARGVCDAVAVGVPLRVTDEGVGERVTTDMVTEREGGDGVVEGDAVVDAVRVPERTILAVGERLLGLGLNDQEAEGVREGGLRVRE